MSEIRLGNTQRICAVCSRVLDFHEYPDEPKKNHYDHSFQDQPADHPAVPVYPGLPGQVRAGYRCDFCNRDDVPLSWVVPANNFAMPGYQEDRQDMSDGDWSACDECVAQIVVDDWEGLIRRLSAAAAKRSGLPQHALAIQLARIYNRLRANMTGEPYRIQPI